MRRFGEDPMTLRIGTRLGTYEILGALGAGGMGDVYRARDLRLRREVAVKVLPQEVASNPDRLARFEREARTVAGFNHPNIVTLYSIEEEGGVHFLTMELVEGQSLATLTREGKLPVGRLLEIAVSLVEALSAAHERGVVHRDLKPANVMLGRGGRVKVLDFGLAMYARSDESADRRALGTTQTDPISMPGQVIGTLPYMAPEQVRGERADSRTDIFALGALLYELAVGRRPFGGASSAELVSSILRDTPAPLTDIRPELPEELDRLVGRCLEKDPAARFQSAPDLARELRRMRQSLEEHATRTASADVQPSIAVLPFVNRSRDEEDEYFSDGLADELLNVLSKIPGLKVAARTSSFQFKGRSEDVAVIGEKLKVATLLEGSVRKAGPRVRVSVQLVKVPDGYHLWSDIYDRKLEDIFAVQDDIAQAVVKELRTTLLRKEAGTDASNRAKADVAFAVKGRGRSAESHRLHLQGRHVLERVTRQDVSRGIEYINEALRLDPENALAWVELARANLIQAGYGWSPIPERVASAQEAVNRALAIEPNLAEAYIMLARLQLSFLWDWNGADASYRRAQELAPGSAVGLHGVGVLLENRGRTDEAIEIYRLAVEQDPLSAGAYARLGKGLLSANRFAEAEAVIRTAIELAPQRVLLHTSLAMSLLAQGRAEEALKVAAGEPENVYRHMAMVVIHNALGNAAESDEALRVMIAADAVDGAVQICEAHTARGEFDEAFAWLERAYVQRDPGLTEVKLRILLRPLHGDPRWRAFMRKMGFEE